MADMTILAKEMPLLCPKKRDCWKGATTTFLTLVTRS